MSVIFADTSYYLALANPADAVHAKAIDFGDTSRDRVLTTDFILAELGNALSRANVRTAFLYIVSDLRNDPRTTVLPATRDLFDLSYDLFARRPDKDWSLTDCISFEVMREQGLTDALTADRHFEQAGFVALLR